MANQKSKFVFPISPQEGAWEQELGMTKREYFSCKLMSGILSNSSESDVSIEHMCKVLGITKNEYSYEKHYAKYITKTTIMFTDELIRELNSPDFNPLK